MFDQDAYGSSVFANAVNRAADLAAPYPFVSLDAIGNYDREALDSGLFTNRGSFGAAARPGTRRTRYAPMRMKVLSGFGQASNAAAAVPQEIHDSTEGTIVGVAATGNQTQTGTVEEEESFFAKNKTYIVAGVAGVAALGLLFMVAKKKR